MHVLGISHSLRLIMVLNTLMLFLESAKADLQHLLQNLRGLVMLGKAKNMLSSLRPSSSEMHCFLLAIVCRLQMGAQDSREQVVCVAGEI